MGQTVMDPEGPWEFDPLCLRFLFRSVAQKESTRLISGRRWSVTAQSDQFAAA